VSWRRQQGQAIVLTVLLLPVMAAGAATVLDVGSWYLTQRQAQSVADAAALAGAQAALAGTADATTLARDYAAKNGGSLASISFASRVTANDTISVTVKETAPGYFSKLFGISSVAIKARASALAANPSKVQRVAPITIGEDSPQLRCGAPCYGQRVDFVALPTGNYNGNATNFSLVDLSGGRQAATADNLARWLRNGYDELLALGQFTGADTGIFNAAQFRSALEAVKGRELVMLVHASANGNEGPAGATYNVVGWAAFVVTGFSGSGRTGTMTGYFTSVNIGGVPTTDARQPYYGVKTIHLID
jgi:Flp pilus assembly protein TadG